LLHAHLVFVTKYRRPVFTDDMLTFAEHTMGGVCAELDTELIEFNGEADHVHLLVAYPPTVAISTLTQRLKAGPERRALPPRSAVDEHLAGHGRADTRRAQLRLARLRCPRWDLAHHRKPRSARHPSQRPAQHCGPR
jgi:REP element-mobilizing transposase RayT